MGTFSFYIDSNGIGAEVSVSGYVVPGFDSFDIVSREWFKRVPGLLSGLVRFERNNVIDNAARNALPRAGERFRVNGEGFTVSRLAWTSSS